MDMEKKLLERSSGETRLNPDEQRYYLGTFGERVVLTASLADASSKPLQEAFEGILTKTLKTYAPLALKISSNLKNGAEIAYLKVASNHNIPATIVTEEKSSSPFGLVLHTNKAENLTETDARQLYPEIFQQPQEKSNKPNFWQRLFGKTGVSND